MIKRKIQYHEEIKQKRVVTILKAIGVVIGSFCVLSFLIYFLFISSLFKITSISITGEKYIQANSLVSYFSFMHGKNSLITFLNTSDIKKKFPLIETVQLQKDSPSRVHIIIKEYPPYGLVQTSSITYVSSYNGLVIDNISNTSTKYSLPLIVSTESQKDNIPFAPLMKYIGKLEADKKEFITNFIFNSPYDLTTVYSDGHTALLTLNKSIDTQITQLDQIAQYVGFAKCKHVDVRFDNVYCSSS